MVFLKWVQLVALSVMLGSFAWGMNEQGALPRRDVIEMQLREDQSLERAIELAKFFMRTEGNRAKKVIIRQRDSVLEFLREGPLENAQAIREEIPHDERRLKLADGEELEPAKSYGFYLIMTSRVINRVVLRQNDEKTVIKRSAEGIEVVNE